MSLPVGWRGGGSFDADAIANGTIPASKLAEPPGLSVRRAARFADNGAIFISHPQVLTSNSFRIRFSAKIHSTPGDNRFLVGRRATGGWSLSFTPSGALQLMENTGNIVASIPGVVDFDGSAHQWEFSVSQSPGLYEVKKDGSVIASGSHALTVSNTLNPNVGASGNLESGDCAIWDVEFIDPASAANSATFALNGDFTNSRAGSEIADATPTGLIQWATVLTTQGSARAVLAGRPVFLHGGYNAASQAIAGVATFLDAGTVYLNETGTAKSASNFNLLVAPAPGAVAAQVSISLEANADPGDIATFTLLKSGAGVNAVRFEAGSAGRESLSIATAFDVASGDTVRAYMADIAATTTGSVTAFNWLVQFYPNI